MLPYLRAFDWKTFLGVMLAWYFLPVIGGMELMRWTLGGAEHGDTVNPSFLHNFLMTTLLAWCAIAPVGCGYSVARFAKQLPLLTILLAIVIGYVLQATRSNHYGWIGHALWALLSFGGAALGFWMWRLQNRQQA
jgi:hypothetical protein